MWRAATHDRWWHTSYLLCALCGDKKQNHQPRDFHPFKDELDETTNSSADYLHDVGMLPASQQAQVIEELMRRGRL